MKIAVMQPYLFPYLGFYQLVKYVDVFVLYDDVNFIKRGFVNRNYILSGGEATRITVPVPGASQNKRIRELEFSNDVSKTLETIRHAYSKAPYFDDVYPLVESVLAQTNRGIADVCNTGITKVFRYLGCNVRTEKSSDLIYDRGLPADKRIIDISRRFEASEYINSVGGKHLYSKELFGRHGVDLKFIRMSDIRYEQRAHEFVPNLSVIDALMWCPPDRVRSLMDNFWLE